jgi:3-hydroxybutyryl-CoA dehydratase
MPTAKFDDFKVGDTASIMKTISEADISRFAEITGDFNPLHMNDEYAKKSMFGKRVAHGILSAGLISAVLGMKLPGPGALYLDQTLTFKKPVFIGDTLTAKGTIKDKIVKQKEGKPPMNLLKITTIVTKQDGAIVTEGEATIMLL